MSKDPTNCFVKVFSFVAEDHKISKFFCVRKTMKTITKVALCIFVCWSSFDYGVFISVAEIYIHTYRVLQTIQMKLILICVWAEPAVLGSTKTALKLEYEI